MPQPKSQTLNHFKILSIVLGILVLALSFSVWNFMNHSKERPVEIYFTQTAPSAIFAPEGDGSNVFFLTLSGVGSKLSFVSDAPSRDFGTIETASFASLWKREFASDHPNASLVAYDDQKNPVSINLELVNASYTPQTGSIIYTARLLSNGNFPQKLTDVSLFIDSINIDFINQSSEAGAGILIFQKNPGL
jgi:hypothetical protein